MVSQSENKHPANTFCPPPLRQHHAALPILPPSRPFLRHQHPVRLIVRNHRRQHTVVPARPSRLSAMSVTANSFGNCKLPPASVSNP